MLPSYIHFFRLKKKIRNAAITTQKSTITQNANGLSAHGSPTFMPYSPVMKVKGSTMVEIIVRTRMISLVRCD